MEKLLHFRYLTNAPETMRCACCKDTNDTFVQGENITICVDCVKTFAECAIMGHEEYEKFLAAQGNTDTTKRH